MFFSLILAATRFCNPMSIPDTPIGILCRDCRNGDAIPEKGWMNGCWVGAACKFSEVRQFRELADPVVLSAPPPAPVVMETLRDWTTYGVDGDTED